MDREKGPKRIRIMKTLGKRIIIGNNCVEN
jgi:hypothetical protein